MKHRYRYGSTPLSLAVSTKLYQAALASAPRTSRKQPVLPPDHKRSNRSFAGVIVRTQQGAIQVAYQLCPLPDGVANRLAQRCGRGHLVLPFLKPREQLAQYGSTCWRRCCTSCCGARSCCRRVCSILKSASMLAKAASALPLVGETSLASKNFRRACAQQPTCITPGWLPNSV